jgi:hypothetical protein
MMSAEAVSAMAILIPALAGAFVVISRELRQWRTKNCARKGRSGGHWRPRAA